MRVADGKLRFGIALQGGGAHWRDPAVVPDAASRIEGYQEFARIGEAAKLDFGFIADSAYITKDSPWEFLTRPDPMTVLSALCAMTSRLGLVGTFTTSYSYPFTTARQLASLDMISRGRAGWNVVTAGYKDMARNYGGDELYEHAERYAMAEEYIDVCKGLWDSFDDDAFIRDRQSGKYLDYAKMHQLDHKGKYFQVQGPLNMERTPQGYPVIVQAGASEEGRRLAARNADIVFASVFDAEHFERVTEYSQDIRRRAAGFGRRGSDVLVMPAIYPVVGSSLAEANARYEHEVSFIDVEMAINTLIRFFNFYDLRQFPLDEPLPDLGDLGSGGFETQASYYRHIAREEKLTLRQLAYRATMPRGEFVGTPEHIANRMRVQFETGMIDGYVLFGSHALLRDFSHQVLPLLRKQGLFREDYEGSTLREHLGLDRPASRYVD